MREPFHTEPVHVLFRRTAEQFATHTAIERGDARVTYAALAENVARLAHALREVGLAPGARVGIFADDSAAVVTSILGVLEAGGVFVPLDPRFPRNRIATMVGQISPAMFVAEPRHAAALVDLVPGGRTVVRLDELVEERTARPEVVWSADQACSIYSTSGSTGRPKAIVGRLSGIDHFVKWEIEALGIGPHTRVSQLASPAFDGFLKDVFVPLCVGGVVCAPETRDIVKDAQQLADWIDLSGIEVLQCVPSVFRTLINQRLHADYFSALRWVVLAGEAVLPADVARVESLFGSRIRIANLYGPTETTITKFCYLVQPGDGERTTIPIGKPIPGAAATILTASGQVAPRGVPGEIYIRTRHRSLGYFGDPEQTAAAFVPNPFRDDPEDLIYRTGDFGRELSDGTFEFLGRRDQQVKVRGVRVELGEIENALQRYVAEVAVIDHQDATGMTSLVAYVVGETTGLRERLRAELPEAMVPSAFVALDALPRTLNGKLDRKALPALEEARKRVASRPPRGATEEILAGIWSEVLRLPAIDPTENFFELGGHSLLATQIISRVREAFAVELPLRTLFEHPTIEALARQLGAAKTADHKPIVALPRAPGAPLPLSYAQERMWVLEQLAEGRSAYHLPLALRLTGSLNVSTLEQALGEIVRRHEILRTRFVATDGQPMQIIDAWVPQRLFLVDVSTLGAELTVEVPRIVAADARRAFDLARGPLVRTTLLRLAPGQHILVCTLHHMVTDAWSFRVLSDELGALCAAFGAGSPSPLVVQPIQYADYAAWQRTWLGGDELANRLAYWRDQLADAPVQLQLPQRRRRPAVQSHRGRRHDVAIDPALTAALRALARREGTTLYMTMMTGFCVLLAQYTGQDDLVLGSVIANRDRAEIEPLIGFFANTLVLRHRLADAVTFRDVLVRVRETCLGAYANQVPPETLVEALAVQRGGATSALYEVWFQLEAASDEPLQIAGIAVDQHEVGRDDTTFELSLVLSETLRGIKGRFEYDSDVFEATTIAQLAEDFVVVLRTIARDPLAPLSSVTLASEDESAALVAGFATVDLTVGT